MKFRLRLKAPKKPKSRTQYDFQKGDEFRLKLAHKYQLLAELGDTERTQEPRETDREELWNNLEVWILESAKETLGVKRTQPRKPWVTPETLAMIEEKRSCPGESERYRQLKRKVRSSLRRDRRIHLEGICDEMEEYQKRNDSKDMFAAVNRLTKQACPTVKLVRDKQGHVLTEDPEILQRWGEYCENLYQTQITTDTRQRGWVVTCNLTPCWKRWKRPPMRNISPGKAAGPDEILAELLKLGEGTVIKAMHRIIEGVWQTGKWPE